VTKYDVRISYFARTDRDVMMAISYRICTVSG